MSSLMAKQTKMSSVSMVAVPADVRRGRGPDGLRGFFRPRESDLYMFVASSELSDIHVCQRLMPHAAGTQERIHMLSVSYGCHAGGRTSGVRLADCEGETEADPVSAVQIGPGEPRVGEVR